MKDCNAKILTRQIMNFGLNLGLENAYHHDH